MNNIKRTWLIACRKARGLTQQEIANAIGISQQTYAQYETGARNPRPKIALKISKVFKVDLEKFYNEKDN